MVLRSSRVLSRDAAPSTDIPRKIDSKRLQPVHGHRIMIGVEAMMTSKVETKRTRLERECEAEHAEITEARKRIKRAQRIRSYMEDSGMSRKEATAMVDFEDGK